MGQLPGCRRGCGRLAVVRPYLRSCLPRSRQRYVAVLPIATVAVIALLNQASDFILSSVAASYGKLPTLAPVTERVGAQRRGGESGGRHPAPGAASKSPAPSNWQDAPTARRRSPRVYADVSRHLTPNDNAAGWSWPQARRRPGRTRPQQNTRPWSRPRTGGVEQRPNAAEYVQLTCPRGVRPYNPTKSLGIL